MSETRKAGDYTVINSIKIGGKEIVIGENIMGNIAGIGIPGINTVIDINVVA